MSNQVVAAQSFTAEPTYLPMTGEEILEALNNPNHPLFKDRVAAEENIRLAKKDRAVAKQLYLIEKEQELKKEELEAELAERRNEANNRYRENLQKYYDEQRALIIKEALVATTNDPQQAAYHVALASFVATVKELAETEEKLTQLEEKYSDLCDDYAENQLACAVNFNNAIDTGATFEMNGDTYSLDKGKLSASDRQIVDALQEKTANLLADTRLPAAVMADLPPWDPVKQHNENNGGSNDGKMPVFINLRKELNSALTIRELLLKTQQKNAIRAAAKQANDLLAPYQMTATTLQIAISQTGVQIQITREQCASLQVSVMKQRENLMGNPIAQRDSDIMNGFNNLVVTKTTTVTQSISLSMS